MIAAYGPAVLNSRPLSYAEYVGLFLNRERVEIRRANAVARGMMVATGRGRPTAEWFKATSDDDAEAAAAYSEDRLARAAAEALEAVRSRS